MTSDQIATARDRLYTEAGHRKLIDRKLRGPHFYRWWVVQWVGVRDGVGCAPSWGSAFPGALSHRHLSPTWRINRWVSAIGVHLHTLHTMGDCGKPAVEQAKSGR